MRIAECGMEKKSECSEFHISTYELDNAQRARLQIAVFFPVEKRACGPEARALCGKSIGPVISDFGFFEFFSIRIPQSPIRISIDPSRDFGINSFHKGWRSAFSLQQKLDVVQKGGNGLWGAN
jgi:hypothetical protein